MPNASLVELFAAAGLTAFSAYWAGGKNAQALSNQAAVEQMSMFYVLLCHHLGVDPGQPLPSIQLKQSKLPFPTPNLGLPPNRTGSPTLAVYQTRDGFHQELNGILPRQFK